jgi:hypothetical protein
MILVHGISPLFAHSLLIGQIQRHDASVGSSTITVGLLASARPMLANGGYWLLNLRQFRRTLKLAVPASAFIKHQL